MKENKILLVIAAVVVVALLGLTFLIGGGSSKSPNISEEELSNDPSTILSNAQEQSDSVKDNEKKDFIQIDINKYLEYHQANEGKYLVLVARPTCGYCQIAEPIIQNIAYEYNVDINYLNTDNFSDDDQTTFIQSDELFSTGYGTPLLLVINKGTIVDKVDGLTDYAHYVVFLQNNGFII